MTSALPRTPSFRLDSRRALVTGAGRGPGLACAAALAEAGAEVWLAARSAGDVQAAAAALRDRGDRAHALVLGKVALGRVGRVEDVMDAVLFLAGDAAAMVTGSALMVDGGWAAA